jgi:hypothetical protein
VDYTLKYNSKTFALIGIVYYNFREYIFIKDQNILESSWTSFLQPFDCWLWVAVLVTVVLLSVSLCLTCRCSRRFGLEDPDTEALSSLSGSLFVIYTTLCRQGNTIYESFCPENAASEVRTRFCKKKSIA